MAWTQTSATDIADLQTQLRTFLLANGWTSGGAGIVVNSDGYKFRISANTTVYRNSYPFTDPDVPDFYFDVEFDQTTIGGVGYSPKGGSNDFQGPFPNAWFFTDGKAAHVVGQSGSTRYTHASFGSLDHKGVHAAPIAFHAGLYYTWWRQQANYWNDGSNGNNYSCNYPSNTGMHEYGHFGHDGQIYVGVPDGVADPLLDFADGPIFNPSTLWTFNPWDRQSDGSVGNVWGYMLDFLTSIENKPITGGVPLIPVPLSMWGSDEAMFWLGEIPNFRACKLNGLNPAQTITYAGEDWIVFPIKQQGEEAATRYGTNPLPDCNTVQYGFAYKKA